MTAFPLSAHASGRYFVDANGVPFRIHGEPSWDAHFNLSATDLQTYVTDAASKGINAFFTYTMNSVAYVAGSSAPWLASLGGSGAGASALPFLKNLSGGTWDGDPTFANHDADFSTPNDAFFAAVASFVDICATAGIVCLLAPMYLGYSPSGGVYDDGWSYSLAQSGNTSGVCNTFGQYLANGHGTFTGFKGKTNIIWIMGGDQLPANGGTVATRALAVLQGMQTAGDTHLVAMHWQHDYLPNDQTDFSSYLTGYGSYTHGAYPTQGPTYAEGRQIYSAQIPSRPTFLIETAYWGGGQASRANIRYYSWASSLSCGCGAIMGFGPFWTFADSADGSTSSSSAGSGTNAWLSSHAYLIYTYVSHAGNFYKCTAAGTSASSGGPTGTGSSISDGSCTWAYVAAKGATLNTYSALLNDPGRLDHQQLGTFMSAISWWKLVPSALAAQSTLITSGQGTFATWSDGNPSSGGMDWIVSAAAFDGSLLVAYVPSDHSGSFTVAIPASVTTVTAYWFDPTNGARTVIGSYAGGTSQSFTVPGANAAGDNDWALLIYGSVGKISPWMQGSSSSVRR